MEPILEKIILTVVGLLVSGLITWLGTQIVKYKKLNKKEEDQIIKNTIIDTLSTGLEPIKTDISDLKNDVGKLKTDISNIQTDVSKMKKEIRNLQNSEVNFSTRLNPMQSEIEHLKDDITELLVGFEKQGLDIENLRGQEETLAKETRSAWRYRIRQLCHVYIARGCMTAEEFNQLQKMFCIYTAIGGNGQTKDLYDKAMNVPIKSPEEVQAIIDSLNK